jgi:hypothetical protein
VPNNHVFTNALSGIYLKLIDAKELLTVLQTPALLRAFYLAFGLGTLVIGALTAYRFLGRVAALIMVVLFGTTIAYLNFVVQVRGYSPSIFFAAGLLLVILTYLEQGNRASALACLALSAMLLYSIPSNLYFLLALFVYFFVWGIYEWFTKRGDRRTALAAQDFQGLNRPLTLSLALALGCALAVLAYLPILDKILENRYVEALGAFQGSAFPGLLIESLKVFISGRGWLFALAAVGIAILFIDKRSEQRRQRLPIIYFLAASLVLPFLLSAVRGDEPFVRSFFVLMPAFFLLAAAGLQALFERIPRETRQGRALAIGALLALAIYANAVFFSTYALMSSTVAATLANEDVAQVEILDTRLGASVFLDHYHLNELIEGFRRQANSGVPVLIDRANTRYVFTLSVYFEAYGIDYEEFEQPEEIQGQDTYIFLSYPHKALSEWQVIYPDLNCKNISAVLTIYQVLYCQFE